VWHFQIYRLRPLGEGVFRSRQPRAGELARAIERHHIRTVINLRGWNPGRGWYRAEERVAKSSGVTLVNLPLETFDWPPRIETQRFVLAVESARRPVLLHCATGVDRTGWGAAVIRLLRGDAIDAALEELSRTRGHLCDRATCPLHRFFEMYRSWLGANSMRHDGANFRRWALEVYCPIPYDAEIHLTGAAPEIVRPGQQVRLRALVTNRSPESWVAPIENDRGIRLGARVLGPFDKPPAGAVDRFRLPRAPARDLFRDNSLVGKWPPGRARDIAVTFTAPERPGLYLVQVDMVDELVHWFSDLGREGVVLEMRVGE
jgi:protein tyrosine phosphatase (PTP) superfamily phosphohydrolase (DUF442 family)